MPSSSATPTRRSTSAAATTRSRLYKKIFRELVTYMIEDPKNITRALHLLLVARNFERMADHATNIAEDVVYYVEGRDIRHGGPLGPGA
jgi:phosphate transport system protein